MKKFIFGFALLLLNVACGKSQIEDPASVQDSSNVSATESGGIVTAEIKADATEDQRVVASLSSAVASSSVTFPLGAIRTATTITLGEGDAGLTDSGLSELGVSSAAAATLKSSPLNVGALTVPSLEKDADVKLPLPVKAADLGTGSGAALAGKYSVFFLSIVYTSPTTKVVSLKKLGKTNLVGTFAKVSVKGIGWFQILVLPSATTESEKTSNTKN